jgi:hypothetical protein
MNGEILVNGIDALTGAYLPVPGTEQDLALRATLRQPSAAELIQLKCRIDPVRAQDALRAPIPGVDPLRLDSAGWAVVFAPDVGAEVREALRPLLDHRRTQAGAALYQEHDDSIVEGLTAEFLARRKTEPGNPNPRRYPYYVLLVGDPRKISFRFQYELDVQYAVGRLWLDRPEDYESYARNVVRAETKPTHAPGPKRMTFFGVANPDDRPTGRLCKDLLQPLAEAFSQRAGWKVGEYLGSEATRAQLGELLGGPETPDVLFTGSHGLGFRINDEEELAAFWERQLAEQGALICQDWPGPETWKGAIPPEHYFAGRDLKPGTDLRGLFAFLFACYSGGTPEYDSFSDEPFGTPPQIADAPFVAQLPKRLLSSGALAVIAHVDRAWTTSFSWTGESQPEVFKSTLTKLLDGEPLGWCMEYLNTRHAELSVELCGLFQNRQHLVPVDQEQLSRVWRANNDARNFIVLGDPAVRLAVPPSRRGVLRDGAKRDTRRIG